MSHLVFLFSNLILRKSDVSSPELLSETLIEKINSQPSLKKYILDGVCECRQLPKSTRNKVISYLLEKVDFSCYLFEKYLVKGTLSWKISIAKNPYTPLFILIRLSHSSDRKILMTLLKRDDLPEFLREKITIRLIKIE